MSERDEALKHIDGLYTKINKIVDRHLNLPDQTITHMQHAKNVMARVPVHEPISEPWRQFSLDLLDCVDELVGDVKTTGRAMIEMGEAISEAAGEILESKWIRQ
jgi:hypothetical protein